MARSNSRTVWFLACLACLSSGLLYGGTLWLRDYNPAFEVRVSEDMKKILIFEQYPGRMVARSVAFAEVTSVELVGAPTFVEPRRAEVYVSTLSGDRIRVHVGNDSVYNFADALAQRLDQALLIQNYKKELKVDSAPAAAAPPLLKQEAGPPAGVP